MRRAVDTLGRPLIALVVALFLGAVVIAVVQKDVRAPLAAYNALFRGAFVGGPALSNTLARTMPLLLTGASVAVALAAGLFNIGAEGQLAVGGLASAYLGYALAPFLPAPVLLVVALAGGALAGATWAFLPGFLKVKRGAHEVITAILLNYVAQNVTRYLASGPLKQAGSPSPQTPEIGAFLPRLSPIFDVHAGLPLALVVVALIAVALRRTVWGYETRATGEGPGAAEASGVPIGRVRINAMCIAGALSGLAGAIVICGEVPFRRFPADFYGAGYGFDGLAVALLAGGSPWGILPAALLFGAMGAGAEQMAFDVGTPKQIVSVVQAILIVAVAARLVVRRRNAALVAPTPPAVETVANRASGGATETEGA